MMECLCVCVCLFVCFNVCTHLSCYLSFFLIYISCFVFAFFNLPSRLFQTFFTPLQQSVRKADTLEVTTQKLSEPEDMICTMRIWHKQQGGGSSGGKNKQGMTMMKKTRSSGNTAFDMYTNTRGGMVDCTCEILLKPIPQRHPSAVRSTSRTRCRSSSFGGGGGSSRNKSGDDNELVMSQRFQSFGSGSTSNRKYQLTTASGDKNDMNISFIGNVQIPISDIMIVDDNNNNNNTQKQQQQQQYVINLTTMSHGYFEMTMMNQNGQEILLAFLKANLPNERILIGRGGHGKGNAGGIGRSRSDVSHSTASSSKSVDAEVFLATRITEKINNETLSERVRRKFGRALKSVEECKYFDFIIVCWGK